MPIIIFTDAAERSRALLDQELGTEGNAMLTSGTEYAVEDECCDLERRIRLTSAHLRQLFRAVDRSFPVPGDDIDILTTTSRTTTSPTKHLLPFPLLLLSQFFKDSFQLA